MNNVTLHTDPSPYVLIEDVFSADDYKNVLEFAKTLRYGDNLLNLDCNLFSMLQNKAWKMFAEIYPELSQVTDGIFSNVTDAQGTDSFFRILIKKLAPGFDGHMIHRDAQWKQMVVVVYLNEQGMGTKLYSEDDAASLVKTLPFKPNTAFATIPNQTNWHDYEHPATFDEDRLTLMFMMADKRYYK